MFRAHFILIFCVVIVLQACLPDDDENRNPINLEGNWRSGCALLADPLSSDSYYISTLHFKDNRLDEEIIYFTDSSCQLFDYELETSAYALFQIGEEITAESGHTAYSIDLEVFYNDVMFSWVYSILAIINGQLYLGQSTPNIEERDHALNFEIPYSKVSD